MGPRYLKPGEDFGESHFAEMGLNYRDPSPPYNNPVGRSTHWAYAKGGATPKKTKAIIAVVTPSKPPKALPAREKVKGALQAAAAIGALAGARKRPAPPMFSDGGLADMQIPAPKYGSEASTAGTGLKKGGKFIQKAITHEGRETDRAKAAGRSVHQQMEHDKHSKNPSLRSAANLGLRLTKGDLRPHKRKG